MENKQEKKSNKGLVIILILIILGLGGYLVYDKLIAKYEFYTEKEEVKESEKYNTISEYLSSYDDLKITLTKTILDDTTYVYEKTLTANDAKDFLKKLEERGVKNEVATGLGGPNLNELVIEYSTYKLSFYSNMLIYIDQQETDKILDEKLKNIINTNYELIISDEVKEGYNKSPNEYVHLINFDGFSDLFESYFEEEE